MYNALNPYEPSPETGLIKLFPGLLHLLTENADLLDSLLPLLDSYIVVDAQGIIQVRPIVLVFGDPHIDQQSFGSTICTNLFSNISTVKSNTNESKRLLRTISLLVRTSPIQALAPLLLDSGLFQFSLKALEDDKAAGLVLAAHLEILTRIALRDPGVFLQMVAEAARREGKDGHRVLEETLDAIWRNFDYVGDATGRKTVAMGVGALLTTVGFLCGGQILNRAKLIMQGHQQCLERLDGEFSEYSLVLRSVSSC